MSDSRNLKRRFDKRAVVMTWLTDPEPRPFIDTALRMLSRSLLAWELSDDWIQTYPASDTSRQWVSQSCACPYCGHTWEAVAPLGSTGIECPACYECDLGYEWRLR